MRSRSNRSPMLQASSPLRLTGICSSGSSSGRVIHSPARSYISARIGLLKKRTRSLRLTRPSSPRSGNGSRSKTGTVGRRSREAARTARRPARSKLKPAWAPSLPGVKLDASNGCNGCRVMILLRIGSPSSVRAVVSSAVKQLTDGNRRRNRRLRSGDRSRRRSPPGAREPT